MCLDTHRLRKQRVSGDSPARFELAAQIDKEIGNAAGFGINRQRVLLLRSFDVHIQCQKMQPWPAENLEAQENRIRLGVTPPAGANGEREQHEKPFSMREESETAVHSTR